MWNVDCGIEKQNPFDNPHSTFNNRLMKGLLQRASGVLLHVTSLPTPFGIGDLGPAAFRWVDLLAKAKQRWWQILPLGPVGAGNSPYQCFSAFAGNPLLISPEQLVEDGLLNRGDLAKAKLPGGRVDYPRVAQAKGLLLASAYERFRTSRKLQTAFDRFQAAHTDWLDDFALFTALHEVHSGVNWTDWPKPLVRRQPAAMEQARRDLNDAVRRQKFFQFLFFRQLKALKAHAAKRHVGIIGDLPIFISANSSDVWAHPEQFDLDRDLRPTAVAGVPPDLFTKDGQRWGNPLYNWKVMQRDGFKWWISRVRAALAQCDLVRMDHFRGFEAYWRVPASAPTARTGKWVKAPGWALFEALKKELRGKLPMIAEDLGEITPAVEKLRDDFELPRMRLLQFAFSGGPTNDHLPHHLVRNCAAYTGTHDNDTTVGWFQSASKEERQALVRHLGAVSAQTISWQLIRLLWSSIADLAVVPAQDLLSLDGRARMNYPGTAEGNWEWRLDDLKPLANALDKLGGLTELYDRTNR